MAYLVSYQRSAGSPWITSMRYRMMIEAWALMPTATPEDRLHAVKVEEVEDEPGWERSNRWFGEAWPYPYLPAPICDDHRLHVPTPEDTNCLDCNEPILYSDSGIQMPCLDVDGPRMSYLHVECHLRGVMCPIDMGLVEDPTGRHIHDPNNRRAEAKLILDAIRKRATA